VVDASVVAAALTDGTASGDWARMILSRGSLAAPHSMPGEVASVFRRHALHDRLPDPLGALALDELQQMTLDLIPFRPFSARIWELRHSVSTYDAWYVAVAETLGGPLATLDHRLARANGPRCEFLTP
jgi:predicted nucleic acid-binding protein